VECSGRFSELFLSGEFGKRQTAIDDALSRQRRVPFTDGESNGHRTEGRIVTDHRMRLRSTFDESLFDGAAVEFTKGIAQWLNQALRNSVIGVDFGRLLSACHAAPDATPAETFSRDRADIRATMAGDDEAYRRLIERHQQALGNYLWTFTQDQVDWEELLQMVFVEAYTSLKQFRGDGAFVDWLRGIATHLGYRYWTRRNRHRDRNHPLCDATVSQLVEPSNQSLGLFELMELLSPKDRLVLTLIYVEQLSVTDAARLTGWSESAVKVQAHRARKKLKLLWDRHHAE
jgi:RNA polymerase sigma-70 factor, ECF subfamily